jgi:GntR family transcriptional regulator/MocR family aminotransferase
MPSVRELRDQLNVSRNTVDLAYHQLNSEGFIVSRPRIGFFIENLDFSPLEVNKKNENNKIKPFDYSNFNSQYDFKYGKLNTDPITIKQWQRLMNKSIRIYNDKMTFYGETFGEIELREEILKYLNNYRGVNCQKEQIFIGAGVHYCLGMICQLIKKHTNVVAMEDPGYNITHSVMINNGFKVESIPLDDNGINIEKLSKTKANAVYVTPSHQYPLGIIMPISRRLELIEWANKNDGIIIEDDYSCHLRYNIKPIQSLQSIAENRVIYIGSFSKFLFPTLRVAYMVIPKNILSEFNALFEGYPSTVPFLIQKTLELFMKEGHWESYLRKNHKKQKEKHDILVKSLNKKFGNKISIFGMNAGLHLLIQVDADVSEKELICKAYEKGVKVYPTEKFWKNPRNKHFSSVVLGFGGIDVNNIEMAVDLLGEAWGEIIS